MQLTYTASKLNQLFFGLILVLFSFTEISVMQLGKALVTPFHIVMLAFAVPVLITAPASLRAGKILLLLLGYIVAVNAIHFSQIRITSFVYTLVYIAEFILVVSLGRTVSTAYLRRIFQLIIILYLVNLGITQLLITTGFYNDILGMVLRSYNNTRPMGFSSEPSYAAFIVTVAYICYNEIKYAQERRNSWNYYFLFLLCIILTTSAYGVIYALIYTSVLMWRMVSRVPFKIRFIVFSFLAVAVTVTLVYLSRSGEGPVNRTINVVSVALSNAPLSEKIETIGVEDVSAWTRFGPTWLLFQNSGLDWGILLGHGSGAASAFFQEQMVGIIISDDREFLDLGIIPAFMYDYGLIGLCLLITLVVLGVKKNRLFILLMVLFFFNAGINTQIFWYALTVMIITARHLTTSTNKQQPLQKAEMI